MEGRNPAVIHLCETYIWTHELTYNVADKVFEQTLILNLSEALGFWPMLCNIFPRLIFWFLIEQLFKCNSKSVLIPVLYSSPAWLRSPFHLFFPGQIRTLGQSWVSTFLHWPVPLKQEAVDRWRARSSCWIDLPPSSFCFGLDNQCS